MQKKTNFSSQKLKKLNLDSHSTIQHFNQSTFHSNSSLNNDSTLQPLNHSNFDSFAVKVEGVSKKYCKSLKRSMLYGVKDIARNTFGLSSHSDKLRKNEFWALDDISFEVKKGETLGIIGPNGSGKTTLLKLLNGIFWPDKGKITIKGKVGALIEVGAGFHPLLTGRENIYINAAILGMTKEETDEKFDSIIDFADIGDFLDVPVKHYSSGMFVRLGFAVAVHCEPDILLVDEILSVGDLSFQNKSLRRLAELREKTHAVVFVSHNLEHMRSICDRVIVLNSGKAIYYGDIDDGIIKYQESIDEKKLRKHKDRQQYQSKGLIHKSSGEIIIRDSGVIDKLGYKINKIRFDEDLTLFFEFELKCFVGELIFGVGVLNGWGVKCMSHWTNDEKVGKESRYKFKNLKRGRYQLIINYKNPRLISGVYRPGFTIRNPITGETYEKIKRMKPFVIKGNVIHRGIITPEHTWKLDVL